MGIIAPSRKGGDLKIFILALIFIPVLMFIPGLTPRGYAGQVTTPGPPTSPPLTQRKMGLMKFYQKPACSTCRKAKNWLTANGVSVEEVDLNRGLTEAEIDALIGKRDYLTFLNFRNELYRERKMKTNPPSRAEAIRLMSEHPNLIRRPILVKGSRIAVGFDEAEFRELSGR